jgi:hypothetical protein
MRSDGRCQQSVFRGRSLISAATSGEAFGANERKSRCLSGSTVGEVRSCSQLEPRSHGEWAWQKKTGGPVVFVMRRPGGPRRTVRVNPGGHRILSAGVAIGVVT